MIFKILGNLIAPINLTQKLNCTFKKKKKKIMIFCELLSVECCERMCV